MSIIKVILPIVMVVVLVLAWVSFFADTADQAAAYAEYIRLAEESIDEKLYEQAIEYYKKALQCKTEEETYEKIKDTYEILYKEEPIAFFRNQFLADMAAAAKVYPENEDFWEVQVDLLWEVEDYAGALEVLKSARKIGVTNHDMDEKYTQIIYMVDLDYKSYADFKTALNGYITVYDGSAWTVINNEGTAVRSRYRFAGLLNDQGKGIYMNSIDARLLDGMEVTRLRFDKEVEDAGFYDESADWVPVKTDGVWRYLSSEGEFMPGTFEIAGSFYNSQAVAYTGKGWVLLDAEGNQSKLDGFEDIKLDLYGCHNQSGIVIAKVHGKYGLYSTDFKEIADLSADEIDLCIASGMIAYKQGDKWGFVDKEGKVLLKPTYYGAKSFSNGYAAVCNADGKWGFVNTSFDVVIDYTYLDAHYFTGAETCMVSPETGIYQMLKFVFS